MSDLRSGSRLIGVKLLRGIVRSSAPAALLAQARRAIQDLIDDVAAVARDDSGPEGHREKAAEFIVHLRARKSGPKSLAEIVNRVAEAAARARYRSGRVVDFLSTWLFVIGEQFIAGVSERSALVELELIHPSVWGAARAGILESLEAGAERLRAGRCFRLAEIYLARFRLMRARRDERERGRCASLEARAGCEDSAAPERPDYVASLVADLFALSLTDVQQRLIVARIPGPGTSADQAGFSAEEHRRLWAPLRAVRTDQAYEHWEKLRREPALQERQAAQEFFAGLATHLRRTWGWFFPDRTPFGVLRAALNELDAAIREDATPEPEEEAVERLFQRYRETLLFIVRLATEDSESAALDLEADCAAGGAL
ncbi:MAG: hypothetical protein HY812_17755 [Planctomycetes bacterium]|nr:hypothetical protein [Planctomycetota bacterium]